MAKNDEYIRAAEQEPQRQSIEEIDRLLLEAGLQLPRPKSAGAPMSELHDEVAIEW